MAQIPGNELFPDSKRNYGGSNIEFVEVTVSGSGTSAYYQPGNARCVLVVATGAATFQMVNEDGLLPRQLILAGQTNNPSATQVGIISGDVMPHSFALVDTSTSSNPMTIYFVY